MSTTKPTAAKLGASKTAPSLSNTSNPFNTVFDDEDSISEAWDEIGARPNEPSKASRITQLPSFASTSTVGVSARSASRTSVRRPDRAYSVKKPTREKSRGRQRQQNALAGIKLNTNFSRAPGTTGARPVQLPQSKTMPHVGNFVDLATLQALGGETSSFWKSRKERDLKSANTHRRKNTTGLTPSPLNLDSLSPADRPIVIGISIPTATASTHALSPETATSDTSRILNGYGQRAHDQMSPETPTIIITPAHAGTIWSALEGPTPASLFPRPSSSIYSVAPANAMGIHSNQDAPPIPQMPVLVLETERQRIAAQRSYFSPDSDDGTMWEDETPVSRTMDSRSRTFSSCTVFEEDESPILVRAARAISVSTNDVKRASISTTGTRRRSMGWWNYITTPFLTRSNTVASREFPDFHDAKPPVPNLALAAVKAQEAEKDRKQWEKQFSPLTPATTTTISSEAWWETSAKEDESKHQDNVEPTPKLRESRHKVQNSSGSIPMVRSQPVLMGGDSTTSLSREESDSQLARDEQSATTEVQPTRELQTNNPFAQSRSEDHTSHLTRSPAIQPVRAQALRQGPVLPSPPPPYSPQRTHVPRYRAVLPPSQARDQSNLQYPVSPGPMTPGLQQAMSSRSAIPMSEVPLTPAVQRMANPTPLRQESPQPTMNFDPPPLQAVSNKKARKAEAKRQRYEKEDAIAHKAGGLWRGRGCVSNRGCYGRTGPEGRKKRRCYLGLILGSLSVMMLIIVLAVTLHRKSNTVVGPSQWLNLTGFPPIYSGLSTVAAPNNVVANTGCVVPSTQWSCSLPAEQQASVAPNHSNQPNFLFDIQWDNSSAANATFENVTGNPSLVTRRSDGNAVSAGQFLKSMVLKARQVVTFAPNPAPPSWADGYFLGNTTDGIVSDNKAGEPTPFYISILTPPSSMNTKRQILERGDSADSFPNVTEAIPAPSLNKDGTAYAASLLPFPSQQPIRLYDRGLPSEHYGFYTYFDRSIFMKSISVGVPDDMSGSTTEADASFRCTWAQTRFLVQMWTRMNTTAQLLNHTTSTSTSGTDFTQPGSFPYPITITIDRHGGDPTKKMLYCYDMKTGEGINASGQHLVAEDRAFGGTIINPAANLFSNETDSSLGGVDGGTGGCSCQWNNFVKIS